MSLGSWSTEHAPPLAALVGAIVLTWEKLSGLALPWRLCAVVILGLVAQYFVAQVIARRLSKNTRTFGFLTPSHTQAPKHKQNYCLVLIFVALAISPVIAVGLGFLQTITLIVSVVREEESDVKIFQIYASENVTDLVRVSLPRSGCDFEETGATITELGPDSGEHIIEISRFVAPQAVAITCDIDSQLQKRDFFIEGQPEGPYFESELYTFQVRTLVAGGLTWLLGALLVLVHLRWLSRR